jgi:excisionase family DNA binding protein
MKRKQEVDQRITMRPDEAAKIAGCGDASIRKLIKEGVIPHIRFGRKIVISRAAFFRWLDNGEQTERRRA